jgi:hypothetical protein
MTTECKIKAHVLILKSKIDLNGNSYYSCIITRTSDGKMARGQISGGESNVTYAMRVYFDNWESFIYTVQELPKREYNRLTKSFPYIGCTPDEINKNIDSQWEG